MHADEVVADLKTLADYQHAQRRTMVSRVMITPIANQAEVVFHAVRPDGKTAATAELVLRQIGLGKLALWESFGDIRVVTGSLKQRTSTIRLTQNGLEIAAT
jgi:hypothetical protein